MNRRSFLSFLAGLPVIGRYWSPYTKPAPSEFGFVMPYVWSATGLNFCKCMDPRCAKHDTSSYCGAAASLKYWPFCFECEAVVFHNYADYMKEPVS